MGLFGLGKKQATFGLDIGSSSVKVVELVEGRGGFILEAFARVPLPRDVIADGAIREPGIVAEAVKEALDKAGIKGRSAVMLDSAGRATESEPFFASINRSSGGTWPDALP